MAIEALTAFGIEGAAEGVAEEIEREDEDEEGGGGGGEVPPDERLAGEFAAARSRSSRPSSACRPGAPTPR